MKRAAVLILACTLAGCSWFEKPCASCGPAGPNIPPRYVGPSAAEQQCIKARNDALLAYNGILDGAAKERVAAACWPLVLSLPPTGKWPQ